MLLSDLEQTETNIEDLTAKHQEAVQSKDLLSSSWDFTVHQLEAAQEELKTSQIAFQTSSKMIEEKDAMIERLQSQLRGMIEFSISSKADSEEIRNICNEAINSTEQNWFQLNHDIRSYHRATQSMNTILHQRSPSSSTDSDGFIKGTGSEEVVTLEDNSAVLKQEMNKVELQQSNDLLMSSLSSLEAAKNIIEKKNDALHSILNKVDTVIQYKGGIIESVSRSRSLDDPTDNTPLSM